MAYGKAILHSDSDGISTKGTTSMKQLLSNLRTVLAVAAVFLAAVPFAGRANADEWNKRTVLKVNQTIQISNTVLEPGQYVLQLQDSPSDRHIVEIFNGDQSHIIDTVLTIPNYRVHAPDKTMFTFYETPPGTAKAMRAWYYPGDVMGEEFPYPKTPQTLAMATSPEPAPAPGAAMTEPAPEPPAPAAAPAPPAPAPEAAAPEVTQPEAPVPAETPAPSAAPAPEPAPNPQEQPAQPEALPKTGSPYPLFGIAGVSLVTLAGLLRLKRRSA
jgi:LPXTG-motif cell wall-anchored protein